MKIGGVGNVSYLLHLFSGPVPLGLSVTPKVLFGGVSKKI